MTKSLATGWKQYAQSSLASAWFGLFGSGRHDAHRHSDDNSRHPDDGADHAGVAVMSELDIMQSSLSLVVDAQNLRHVTVDQLAEVADRLADAQDEIASALQRLQAHQERKAA